MKTVVVTGGSRGIGSACVKKFAENGWNVVLVFKSSITRAKELTDKYKNVYLYECDVTDESAVAKLALEVIYKFNKIDVLVNNAGISYEGLLQDMSLNAWNTVITTNLTSMFLMCRAFIPSFISEKSGKIINISSMWGNVGASCEVAYSASKAGVIGFTKSLAKELAPSNIKVNCVSPGVIDTDMMSAFSKDDIDALKDETPLGRIGKTEDVANAVYFLASEEADFICGEIINVNGGFVI